MSELPALLGNSPIFRETVSIARPVAPDFDALENELREVFASRVLTKGPQLARFEQAAAEYLNLKHAIAVSSCTSGLMLTYRALGLTGNAIVPSFTFIATVSSLVWAGVDPRFADVDEGTANLDPAAVEAAITPETSAIIAVHAFGNPAPIKELQRISRERSLALIFDAAGGLGSRYQQQPCAALGDVHVFSLTPTKLAVAGEGGLVATNDDELAEKIRIGREYGNRGDYDSEVAGINARMPELNALLARHSLGQIDEAVKHRNRIAELYKDKLSQLPGITLQAVSPGNLSSYQGFAITINANAFGLTRDHLADALAAENIETRRYFNPPVHRQIAYRNFASGTPLLRSDSLASGILHLPIWSDMDLSIGEGVCRAVERCHKFAHEIVTAGRPSSMAQLISVPAS